MVEVIISKQEVDGIEELKEMTTKFRELIDDVIVAVDGCQNAQELTERLLETNVALYKLQNAIKELNNQV